MTLAHLSADAPTRKWTVEAFARFWADPKDFDRVNQVIWPEIRGYWPRASRPLIGRAAYVQGLADFVAAVPGFRAEVSDHAFNGEVGFVRWVATGRPLVGPPQLVGVDRFTLRDGYVLANYVHSDHPIFAHLAETGVLG
jgi:hypothetical protein